MGNTPKEPNKKYRLSIVEDESLRQIRTYIFTKEKLTAYGVSLLILFVGVIYCLIAFTPVRTTIPGYPDARSRREAVRNAIIIDSLESSIVRWELYAENLSHVLTGEETISLDSIASNNSTKYLQRISDERIKERDAEMRAKVRKEEMFSVSGSGARAIPMEGLHFFTPLKGVITQGYDPIMHSGIDITAKENAVVCATLDGTVILDGWSDNDGYTLQIQHADNLVSTYKHNIKLLKSKGAKVKAGDPVALAGKYLHFEIWHNGEPVNPSEHINLQ